MENKFIKSIVISNLKLNYKFNLLKLKFLNNISFKHGQFITLKITNSVFRCYSIFSPPETLPFWEMFVDITPGGPGTSYIKSLKKGDIIKTSLPTGTFVFHKDGGKNVILAATGCGISPLLPILKRTLGVKKIKNIILLWGLRFKKDIVLENILKEVARKHFKFHYEIILSRPEKKWSGKVGYVQKYIIRNLKTFLPQETSIYLSGNQEFIKETVDNLKETKKTPAHIYTEKCY